MTTLENLLSEHNAIIQKIIVEAKKEAIGTTTSASNINVGIGTTSSTSNINVGIGTSAPTINQNKTAVQTKLDLFSTSHHTASLKLHFIFVISPFFHIFLKFSNNNPYF